METARAPRRVLAGVITLCLLGLIVAAVAWHGRTSNSNRAQAEEQAGKAAVANAWPLFGGTPGRNMVNTVDKNVPTEWDVKSGKNIKWSAHLGSRAYGGPVIAGGKVFVGTNNEAPRNPDIKGDKGVLMCFKESNGKFLWQAVHDKLPPARPTIGPAKAFAPRPWSRATAFTTSATAARSSVPRLTAPARRKQSSSGSTT